MHANPLAFALPLIAVLGFLPMSHAETGSEKTGIQDVKQETQDLLEALKGYGADRRGEAVNKAKDALATLDQRIDDLETRIDNNWDTMNKATRQKARASLRALRKQRIQLAEWYGSLENSSASAWEHVKNGFSNAYQDLQSAWEKAEMEFSGGS